MAKRLLNYPLSKGAAAVKQIDDLLQGLKMFDVHDDFHPFIMNVFKPAVQTLFHFGKGFPLTASGEILHTDPLALI